MPVRAYGLIQDLTRDSDDENLFAAEVKVIVLGTMPAGIDPELHHSVQNISPANSTNQVITTVRTSVEAFLQARGITINAQNTVTIFGS